MAHRLRNVCPRLGWTALLLSVGFAGVALLHLHAFGGVRKGPNVAHASGFSTAATVRVLVAEIELSKQVEVALKKDKDLLESAPKLAKTGHWGKFNATIQHVHSSLEALLSNASSAPGTANQTESFSFLPARTRPNSSLAVGGNPILAWAVNATSWMGRSDADFEPQKVYDLSAYPLNGVGGAILALLLLTCCVCQGGCCCFCCYCSERSMWVDFQSDVVEWLGYVPLDQLKGNDETVKCLVRREARYMMLLPILPLIFFPYASCEEGTPDVVYLVYLLFLIRARIVEARLLWALDASWTVFVYMMVFSSFEHFDWFTDGLFPVQAYVCDANMTPQLAEAFHQSMMPSLAGVVATLHFWGIATLAFLAAALTQQAMAANWIEEGVGAALAADTAGFAAAADQLDEPSEDGARFSKMVVSVTKVLIENCIQIRLQSSGFALTFAMTSRWAKMKALASLAAGISSSLAKSLSSLYQCLRIMWIDKGDVLFLLGFMVPNVVAVAIAIMSAVQVYWAFQCPSHMWNMTSGCIAS